MSLSLPGKDPIPVKDNQDFYKNLKELSDKIEASRLKNDIKLEKIKSLHFVNADKIKKLPPDIGLKIKYDFSDLSNRLGGQHD